MADKVLHPTNRKVGGNIAKPMKSATVEGPTPSLGNLQPYNRVKSDKK